MGAAAQIYVLEVYPRSAAVQHSLTVSDVSFKPLTSPVEKIFLCWSMTLEIGQALDRIHFSPTLP